MFQRLNNMLMGEIDSLSSQEPEFSEKEDDEWILVDFIGGLTTIKVETSPMENLLIEHPSMSVYAVHNACHSLNETGCGNEEFHSPGSPSGDFSALFSQCTGLASAKLPNATKVSVVNLKLIVNLSNTIVTSVAFF
ncbi:hypothetical protein BTVI_80504 [Pitangus sulphuratus]|nr:hypothetical protein BTVI_80504 [Pitangus sulphuratus]